MNIENEKALPKRKSTRLKGFDYSSAGAYFVTICTKDRKRILSHIVKPSSPVGVVEGADPYQCDVTAYCFHVQTLLQ